MMAHGTSCAQLLSMFHFKGKPPPTQQSTSDVEGFVKLPSNHCSTMAVSVGLSDTPVEYCKNGIIQTSGHLSAFLPTPSTKPPLSTLFLAHVEAG